jgi:hypothetical protein
LAAAKPLRKSSEKGLILMASMLDLAYRLGSKDAETLLGGHCRTIEMLTQEADRLDDEQKITLVLSILSQVKKLDLNDAKDILMSTVENNMLVVRHNLTDFNWSHKLEPEVLFVLINPFQVDLENSIICTLCSIVIAKRYPLFYNSLGRCLNITKKIMEEFCQPDLQSSLGSGLKDACIERFEQYYKPIFLMNLEGILRQIV